MAKYTLLINKETQARSIRIKTGEVVHESEQPERYLELRKRAISNINARTFRATMSDLGMSRTLSGGWE